MKINKRFLKNMGVALVLVLLTVTVLAQPVGNAFVPTAQASPLFIDMTGKLDFSALMKQNFNTGILSSAQTAVYEERTVILSLSEPSLIAAAGDMNVSDFLRTEEGKQAQARIDAEQQSVLKKLSAAGIPYTVKAKYSAVDNAIAIRTNTYFINGFRSLNSVSSVVVAGAFAYPQTVDYDTSAAVDNAPKVYGTGVYDSSDAVAEGLDGSGMIVAIIDTGLDYTHAAFLDMPEGKNPVRFTREDIKNILATKDLKAEQKNPTYLDVSDVYINAKVPFAYDYADNDTDVYPSYSVHGTHVAGIVAGHDENGYTDKEGNHVDEEFFGVAPEAQLMICKVFTDDLEDFELGGAETEDILSALEDCILLGVDVINMSLGTSCGFTTTNDGDDEGEYLNRVYNAVGQAGISLVCAASNDFSSGYGGVFGTNLSSNPDSGTVGSPSTFASALAVASISGKKSQYLIGNGNTPIFYEESNDENSNPFNFLDMMLGKDGTGPVEYEYVVVPDYGRPSDYTSDVQRLFKENPNRIALVKRGGDTTFKEKVEVAKSMGACAIIVYNNVSGIIHMSLGDVKDPIPSASIDMVAGDKLVKAAVGRVGTVTLERSLQAGPFMSEFSSWGATPDLKLKPEITAHGGEITSTVPGGYDEQSGTSMASPNMAGVVALIRSYVTVNHPEMSPVEINRRVNQLMMSTATTIYDRDGLPYSPRKQGAGLGSLDNARMTQAYLWTDNASNDYRPKYEFGDDPEKNGVYSLSFYVTNFGSRDLVFETNSIFMTESLAIDGLSVAEQAHLLIDNAARWTVGGVASSEGAQFTVAPGASVRIELTVSLSDAEKNYIDTSFKNGMYVEGFAKLICKTEGQCDLALPFMGFYGDWSKAPMLDYDAYQISAFEQDSSILEDEKPKASVWATQPYNVYYNNNYVIPMGSYVYLLPDEADPVYLSMDHNSISCFNEFYGDNDPNNYLTSYKLKGLYAGLLRNARSVTYTLTDIDTGEVLQSEVKNRIGKAYAGGGTARPAFVDIPLDPVEAGLVSNGHYRMSFEFSLDYGDGSCVQNTFYCDFTADYEAPMLQDVRVRYYDYKDGRKTKQKIYLDLDVFDNHYAQSAMLCYLEGDELVMATDYVTPIYHPNKNGTTTVSIEITDIYDKYKDALYVQFDDYAMNHSVYWLNVSAANASNTPDSFSIDASEQELKLGVYDTHTVKLNGIGDANLSNFNWTSNNRSVCDVRNGEIVGLSEGEAIVTVSNSSGLSYPIHVKVVPGSKTLTAPSISFGAIKDGDGTLVKASGAVDVYPGYAFKLQVETDPWYYPKQDLTLLWESTNENTATVDQNGNVSVLDEGGVSIKATIVIDGNKTPYSATVTLNAKDPYEVNSGSLTKYHGPGGSVVIPTDKNIMMIAEDAFKDHETITEIVIPKTVTQIGKNAFANCTALKAVYFDSKEKLPISDADISIIYGGAFSGCTALELVDLSNVKVITLGRECFYGCVNLKEIREMTKIGTMFDNAFTGCSSLRSVDLSGLHVSGYGVFAYCTGLEEIKTSWFSAIGNGMFTDCTGLRSVDLSAQYIGENAFAGCTSLRSVRISLPNGEDTFTHYIGARAFAGCTSLQSFTVEDGCSIATVGDYAFGSTALRSFTMPKGVTTLGTDILAGSYVREIVIDDSFDFVSLRRLGAPFGYLNVTLAPGTTKYVIESGVLYTADRKTALYVQPGVTEVRLPDGVTDIGAYAFADSAVTSVQLPNSLCNIGVGAFADTKLTGITLPELKEISERAFYGSSLIEIVIPASVEKISSSAFENTPLHSVTFAGTNVAELGDRVFAGCTSLSEITLPEGIATIGRETFAGCSSLTKATVPSFTAMGDGTFRNCGRLKEVIFGADASVLSDMTFYGDHALTKVTLGNKVTSIGAYAFYGCSSLRSIDLQNVTEVGANAFAECVSLKTVTGMDKLVHIGDMAFYNCKTLSDLVLSSTETVGNGAFAIENGKGSYHSVSLPSVREIGVMAFMGSELENVSLPASLAKLGYGAFSGCKNLTAFTVSEENEVFFTRDGVLYRNLPNGMYELCAYPSGKTTEDKKYTVIDGTVSVSAYAFNRLRSKALEEVILPYSLKEIGVSAFFESGITSYVFYSINAPTLATVYREDVVSLLTDSVSGNQVAINGLYYSNFDSLMVLYSDIVGQKSPLKISFPTNGIGYDNYIYQKYFGSKSMLGILMDDVTRSAIDSIGSLLSSDTVSGWLSLDVNAENKEMILAFGEQVKTARRLYNNIVSDVQLAFVSESDRAKLTEIEGWMRKLKEKYSIPLIVSDVRPEDGYRKDYKEGETFSLEGLTLTVIYDDGSVGKADASSLTMVTPKDGVLTVWDKFVEFEFRYGENNAYTRSLSVPVNVVSDGVANPGVSAGETTDVSSETSSASEEEGSPLLVILLICGGVLLIGCGCAIVVRKRKTGKKAPVAEEGPMKKYVKRRKNNFLSKIRYGTVIRWACIILASGAVIALVISAASNGRGGSDDGIPELHSHIVYNANGGLFENNMSEKTIGYVGGTYPINIGSAVVTNGNASVSRQGYIFDGWYYAATDAQGNILYEDEEKGIVRIGEKFDFQKPVEENTAFVLYAGWIKDKTLPIILAGTDVTDSDGVVHRVGERIHEMRVEQGLFTKYRSVNMLIKLPNKKYTLVDYYLDAECTKPVVWPIKAEGDGEAAPIYAKFIEGDWKIVSDANSAVNMLSNLVSGNYYVIADIDLGGKSVGISTYSVCGAVIEGDGHTISNFKVTKKGVEKAASLLGTMKEGAAIRDLTLSDVSFEAQIKSGSNPVYFLFDALPSTAGLKNFAVSGTMTINGADFLDNLQEAEHSHWILPYGEDDESGLKELGIAVSVTCTVGEQTYTYPASSEEN